MQRQEKELIVSSSFPLFVAKAWAEKTWAAAHPEETFGRVKRRLKKTNLEKILRTAK